MTKHNLTQCIRGGSRDGRSGYLLKFGYDAELVETLKRAVPHTEREWREEEKVWWVSARYEDAFKLMFSNFEALALWQGQLLCQKNLTRPNDKSPKKFRLSILRKYAMVKLEDCPHAHVRGDKVVCAKGRRLVHGSRLVTTQMLLDNPSLACPACQMCAESHERLSLLNTLDPVIAPPLWIRS